MSEYPKTENLYARCKETFVAGPEFGFRQPEVGIIGSWLVLDKLDGMNMRVIFRPYDVNNVEEHTDPTAVTTDPKVLIYGRTDRAQIAKDLLASIQEWATLSNLFALFVTSEEYGLDSSQDTEIVLYGEGIGPGIQGEAGAAYGGAKRFVLFDVTVNGKWLDWDSVVEIAEKLGIEHVPVLGRNVSLELAKQVAVQPGLARYSNEHIEGGILRTDPYVFDQYGKRVGSKYKVRDLV